MIKQAIIIVSGKVHGTGFRVGTENTAKQWSLVGQVSNEGDGTVKIIAEGEESVLQRLAGWCYNGVAMAKVDKVDIEWKEPTGQFEGFEIEY